MNISAVDGHSNGKEVIEVSLTVEPAQATGQLVWSSTDDFDGDAVEGSHVELIPEWDQISMPAYTVATSDGTVSGEDLSFNGIGEVLFTGEGTVRTTSISTVTDFTGNYTQEIKHNHTLVGEGMFDGRGTLSGSIISGSSDEVLISDCGDNDSMPENRIVIWNLETFS